MNYFRQSEPVDASVTMKATIEFTTRSSNYQVLKNDEFFEKNRNDNDVVMDLMERPYNSTTMKKGEVAEELWEEYGRDNAARKLEPCSKVEVTHDKSDEEDINERPHKVVDRDGVDLDDFFEEDIKKLFPNYQKLFS